MAAGLAAVGLLAFAASPALANAPNPTANTTKLDSVVKNSDGTVTVTVEGQWTWTTQTNCPQARDGVGYQVAWFDGNTANPIGGSKAPDGVIYVGAAQDNIVHSVETLGGSSAFGNAFWDGVPSSYLSHNTTDSTPTKTDAANWKSNCETQDPSTATSSGTWGPISHIYPAGTTSITLCPVMYDPHGGSADSGKSSPGDLTAGGKSHNSDNSYEGNGTGANGNVCLKSSFSITSPPPSSTPSPTAPKSTVKAKTVKKHKKHKKHKAKRISRKPKRPSGFTG